MERKTTKQNVPTADRDVPAVNGPKRPWIKPEIRIMKVRFTSSGHTGHPFEMPSGLSYFPS